MTEEMKKEIAKDLVELLVGKERMDSFREWEKKNKETKKEISKHDLLYAISKAMSTVYGLSSVKDDNCHAVMMIILNEIFGEEEENKALNAEIEGLKAKLNERKEAEPEEQEMA